LKLLTGSKDAEKALAENKKQLAEIISDK